MAGRKAEIPARHSNIISSNLNLFGHCLNQLHAFFFLGTANVAGRRALAGPRGSCSLRNA